MAEPLVLSRVPPLMVSAVPPPVTVPSMLNALAPPPAKLRVPYASV